MQIDLTGRKVLVCGASEGIGRAIAERFLLCGAEVTALARNEVKLLELGKSAPNPDKYFYVVADLQNPKEAADKIYRINGGDTPSPFHCIINNAGGPPPGRACEAAGDDFLLAFQRHLIASQEILKGSLEFMKSEKFGRIINIISVSVKQPIENLGVSNTLRGAMASWAKTLSKELGPWGITVNNILPGQTRTGRLDALIANTADKSGKTIEEVEAELISKIPVGRFGLAEEFGYAAAFLASNYAGFINGVNLPLDGGFLSCM